MTCFVTTLHNGNSFAFAFESIKRRIHRIYLGSIVVAVVVNSHKTYSHSPHTIVLRCTQMYSQFSVQLINQKKNNKKSQSLDIHLFYCDSRITPSISRLLMFGRMCYVCIQFFRRRRMAELTLATDRKFFHYSTRERETQSECAHVPQMSSKVEITTVLCVRRSFE